MFTLTVALCVSPLSQYAQHQEQLKGIQPYFTVVIQTCQNIYSKKAYLSVYMLSDKHELCADITRLSLWEKLVGLVLKVLHIKSLLQKLI